MEDNLKEVRGFPNYWISPKGKVMSEKGRTLRELKPDKTHDGYLRVVLCKEGKPFKKPIHRLVAEAFISNPSELAHVNHLDEDKENNTVENLEWCSIKHNMNYGNRNSKISQKLSRKVVATDKSGNVVHYFKSTQEAAYYGFTQTSVAACCRGKRKSHKGLRWAYAN